MKKALLWKVHTQGLLEEVLKNPGTGTLEKPINMFRALLVAVGERAVELNDPELNGLMCRLAIYDISDGYDPKYNPRLSEKIIQEGYRLRQRRLKAVNKTK